MRRKNYKKVEVDFTGIAHKGLAVGRTEEGIVIFAKGAVPGDLAVVSLNRKRKGVWTGQTESIIKYSRHRVNPKCEHFGVCGGCSWQQLDYAEQIQQKEQLVRDAMLKIGKLDPLIIESILPCENIYNYRNKLEFTFSTFKWLTNEEIKSEKRFELIGALGFHRPETFDRIVDINQCHLQIEISDLIRNFIRSYALEHFISFYNIKQHTGILRNLIIRTNQIEEVMVVLSISEPISDQITELFLELKNRFSNIVSAYYAINRKKNDSWFDLECCKVFGNDHLLEKMEHVTFQIGPKSFFQTNTLQSIKLYQLIRSFAELSGQEIVYDLYCGVGSIGIFLAKDAKFIIGIEEIPEAVLDAECNARLNSINNTRFYAGDVKMILNEELVLNHGNPDVVIIDPPRAGLHQDVIQNLILFGPQKIVYVSCNPATQARDIALFSGYYKVTRIKPVDMFPQTNHTESIALLIKL
ncbi:MAG: 23S rRNA (uracil(1939)-C(5))-methyltransferase RlmD [Saprospiraceae bacterium]|nr:23S rRNA (uracil(1939)-C(5))-methyltransferase RlmD [Candidatus Defluviibacterium haderslevense]